MSREGLGNVPVGFSHFLTGAAEFRPGGSDRAALVFPDAPWGNVFLQLTLEARLLGGEAWNPRGKRSRSSPSSGKRLRCSQNKRTLNRPLCSPQALLGRASSLPAWRWRLWGGLAPPADPAAPPPPPPHCSWETLGRRRIHSSLYCRCSCTGH